MKRQALDAYPHHVVNANLAVGLNSFDVDAVSSRIGINRDIRAIVFIDARAVEEGGEDDVVVHEEGDVNEKPRSE